MIMPFEMSNIHQIIDIIGHIVKPNRRAIEGPKEEMTFNLCIFFSMESPKTNDVAFISVE